jgi:hypothetical protein
MNTTPVAKALTNTLVVLLFWLVLLLSLFLRDELTLDVILFDLGKAVFIAGASWFFLIILCDTMVKSMVASAKLTQADRYNGGLIYHVTEPSREEKAWQNNYRDEHPEDFA